MMVADVSSEILKNFASFMARGRLAHGYLLTGPRGSGKMATALAVAKLVNCESRSADLFCNACPSCLKIAQGNHPDLHVIAGEDGAIKIEHVRDMLTRVSLRSYEAKKKVFIIRDAETLTPEAANCLLKTLEEPSANSLILLTTAVPAAVLDTVKSRCQRLSLVGMPLQLLEEQIMRQGKAERAAAHFWAYFSDGNIERLKGEDPQRLLKRKNEAIDQFILVEASEPYLREIAKDRDRAREVVRFLFCWVKDLWLVKQGVEDGRVVHLDRLEDLKRLAPRLTDADLGEIEDQLVWAARAADDNFNMKAPLLLIKEKIWKR